MPESIGSKKRTLGPGIVCDKCNNYFANKLERPMLAHPWMRNLRAFHQVPNKKGNSPSLLGHIAGTNIAINLRLGADGAPVLGTERASDRDALKKVISGGFETPAIFFVHDEPPPAEMPRFIGKMALETAAELICASKMDTSAIVDEPYFDNIRMFSRYGNNFTSWPVHQRRIFPTEALMRNPETGEWKQAGFGCTLFPTKYGETFFVFCFYGVEIVMNLGGPSIGGYEDWLSDHGGISPIIERLGGKITEEGEGKAKRTYIHGSFDAAGGKEFDKRYQMGLSSLFLKDDTNKT